MTNVTEGRYPPRDRIWLGVNSIQLLTAAEPITVERLRERIALLAEQEPQLRWFSRPGPGPDRYRRAADAATAAQFAEDLVQELPAAQGPGTPLEAAVGALLDADDTTPRAAIYAGHGMVGHRFPHVFGDGLSAITHLRRLLTGPEPGSKVPFPVQGVDRPLAHALKARYLTGGWWHAPGRVRSDLRLPRFAPPAAEVADGPQDAAGQPSAHPQGPATVQVVVRQLDAAAMQALKDWRKANAGGISTVSMQMAAIRRALAQAGLIPADDGMYVVFDLRPVLKDTTGGNFISVPYLRPGDPLDPVSVNTSMKEASASGLPFVILARGAARAALSRHTPLPAKLRPSARRDVSFSHMRVSAVLTPQLLTGPDGPAMIVAAAMPPNQGSLSFMLTEHGPVTTITAVFSSPFTPRDQVEQVLDSVTKDPVALLTADALTPDR